MANLLGITDAVLSDSTTVPTTTVITASPIAPFGTRRVFIGRLSNEVSVVGDFHIAHDVTPTHTPICFPNPLNLNLVFIGPSRAIPMTTNDIIASNYPPPPVPTCLYPQPLTSATATRNRVFIGRSI